MRTGLVAAALLWAGVAMMQAPVASAGHGGHEGAAQHMDHLAVLLDLTDEQKAQVQAILQEQHAKMKAQFDAARSSGQKPSFDEMKAQHAQAMQDTITKLTPVLSPLQLKKFQILMQEHGPPRGGFHGGPPPGPAPQ